MSELIEVDPGDLHLSPSRPQGADPQGRRIKNP
jgi:hypothetical protein